MTTNETIKIDPYQGETDDGAPYGYVEIREGHGMFFEWRADESDTAGKQTADLVATLDPDETDRESWTTRDREAIEQALERHIREHGVCIGSLPGGAPRYRQIITD